MINHAEQIRKLKDAINEEELIVIRGRLLNQLKEFLHKDPETRTAPIGIVRLDLSFGHDNQLLSVKSEIIMEGRIMEENVCK